MTKPTIVISILVLIVAGLGSFSYLLYKDRCYFETPVYQNLSDSSKVLVVYYSRTGHTETLARAIARELDADILKISDKKYSRDFRGWRNAANDASDEVRSVDIEPATYDLTNYDLVILGSPIWLFRPAPPLWSFAESNDFTDKSVVLFNTFNSRFKQEKIEEFSELIADRGGTMIDHFYIRRGRILFQMNGKTLVARSKGVAQKIKAEILNNPVLKTTASSGD